MLRKTAGAALRTMAVLQLEMQPLVPGAAVPGAPVRVSTQNSVVVPHYLFIRGEASVRGELRGLEAQL